MEDILFRVVVVCGAIFAATAMLALTSIIVLETLKVWLKFGRKLEEWRESGVVWRYWPF